MTHPPPRSHTGNTTPGAGADDTTERNKIKMTTAEITEGARVEVVEADFAASTGDSFLMTLAYGMGLGTKGTVVALPEGLDDEQKKVVRDLGLVAFKIDGDPEDEIGLPVKRSALAVLTD